MEQERVPDGTEEIVVYEYRGKQGRNERRGGKKTSDRSHSYRQFKTDSMEGDDMQGRKCERAASGGDGRKLRVKWGVEREKRWDGAIFTNKDRGDGGVARSWHRSTDYDP